MIPKPIVVNMQQAFQLAISMVLMYWLTLSLNWDLPKYGGLAIALISLDTAGASLRKGMMRVMGTTFGLAYGILILSLFAQNSWLMLASLSVQLVFVAYFLQSSRYTYAWYVAGFLPALVWATTYGKTEGVFSYATFRYLETVAGIVIYTTVCILIWPQRAGDQLTRYGQDVWRNFQELFDIYRRQLRSEETSAEALAKRAKLDGTLAQMLSTIDAAYADTPSIRERKLGWEAFRAASRETADALESWQQSIMDCKGVELQHVLPNLETSLDVVKQRLSRIEGLWQTQLTNEGQSADESQAAGQDTSLLAPDELEVISDIAVGLSHLNRAAVLNFANQLNLLHHASSKLLGATLVLTGLAPAAELVRPETRPAEFLRLPKWDSGKFANALLPAASLIAGWLFWIYFDPPSGPSVANMSATFGLLAVMMPMNVLRIIPLVLVVLCLFVAPTYFLIMPRLSTGPELLGLLFVFVFLARALLVGRLTVLRLALLPGFVLMSGISNAQYYSFEAIVIGAQMILLGLGMVGIVQILFGSLRSEEKMLNSVRKFFRGCAKIAGGYAVDHRAGAPGRRRHYMDTMVVPATMSIQAIESELNYKLFRDNTPERVQRLVDAFQSLTLRLQAMEVCHQRVATRAGELPVSFAMVTERLRAALQGVFEGWIRLGHHDVMKERQMEIMLAAGHWNEQLDMLQSSDAGQKIDDELLTNLYAMMGSVRGLVDAMANTQLAVNEINWAQWIRPRF